ncbi:MAG: phosphodiester glycosidase family protein [Clostridiales bacterium]|jgi:exopolysaccharide biosynthesis protein|nr:phosphodiester glycosidase family protein [Clostridiales bacterium]
MKKIIKSISALAVFSAVIFTNSYKINAGYLLYERPTIEDISKGVTYSKTRQVTSDGLRDIHIIKVPTKDPNIKIKNKTSNKDYGLKEPSSELINSEAGAIGGVNGDFFVLNGTHSTAQGAIVNEGGVIATDNLNNLNKNEYAAFCLTSDGSPFIDYIKTDINFINNGAENIKVHYMNKYPEIAYPIYIDGKAMSNTSPVDLKFPNVTKIVVENNAVTYISQKGETVNIPPNGYVILISDKSIDYIRTVVKVGDSAEIKINANIDYEKIETLVGGGGKLLSAGKLAADGGFHITGRQPRTAIGINKDGSEIYLVVVDGRSHSIGATHEELASIMQKIGAYEAMHLDGGGSSTILAKNPGEDKASVQNTPSEGFERKVINAVGVYNKSASGAIHSIKIKSEDSAIKGSGLPFSVEAYDEYLNKVDIGQSQVTLSTNSQGSQIINNAFYPQALGKITLRAEYNGLVAEKIIECHDISSLIPNYTSIRAEIGGGAEIYCNAKSTNGNTVKISENLKYELYPPDLGKVEGNVFTAARNGNGYIKVSFNSIVYYIDVSVGKKTVRLSPLDDVGKFIFDSSDKSTITGSAFHAKEYVKDGGVSIALNYKFPVSEKTQAAYIVFEGGLPLKDDPSAIKLSVFGDNSKNWLRAKIVDANRTEYILDLAKEIDWAGEKEVSAQIPSTVKYPIYLERVYLASVNTAKEISSTIYIDQLMGDVYYNEHLPHPENSVYLDSLNRNLSGMEGTLITAIGNITAANKPINYLDIQNKAVASISANAQKALLVGENDYAGNFGVPTLKRGSQYGYYSEGDTGFALMSSKDGYLYRSNLEQWQNIDKDISGRGNKNIIIQMDISPFSLKQPKEFELFHEILAGHAQNGKNIFVVSASGQNSSIEVKDGVRYINLGGLFDSSGAINNNFRVLRFKVSGGNMYYELQKIF